VENNGCIYKPEVSQCNTTKIMNIDRFKFMQVNRQKLIQATFLRHRVS